jgi:hypothetical protein
LSLNLQESGLPSSRLFRRRALFLGVFVFALSLFSGIVWRFWREFGNDLSLVPSRVAYDLTLQATLGPIYVGSVFLLPLTLALSLVFGLLIYIGFKKCRLWMVATAFVLMGVYWVGMVHLIAVGAFD